VEEQHITEKALVPHSAQALQSVYTSGEMKSTTLLFTTIFALLALVASAHAKPKIAVLGLEVIDNGGVDKKTTQAAQDFAQKLRDEASRGSSKYSLAPNSAQDLLELKLLSGCADEGRTCMADIGKELGADRLLYGKLEKRKRGFQISLKLLNTKTRQMEKTTTELVPAKDLYSKNMSKWAAILYGRLIGINESGTLVVYANVDQAIISVDGVVKTTLVDGRAKINGLKEGVHSVTIEADGYEIYESDFAIDPGKTEKLDIGLTEISFPREPRRRSDKSSGSGWKVAFVGGMLVTTGLVSGMAFKGFQVSGSLEDEKDAFRDEVRTLNPNLASCGQVGGYMRENTDADQPYVNLQRACKKGRDAAILVNFLIAGSVVSALATAYFGYQGWIVNDGNGKEKRSGRKRKGNRIVITPQLSPQPVGAGLSLEF